MSLLQIKAHVPLDPSESWEVNVQIVECDECGKRTPLEFSDQWVTIWIAIPETNLFSQRKGDFCSLQHAVDYLARWAAIDAYLR